VPEVPPGDGGHVAGLDALVGKGDRLGLGVARQQRLRHGKTADRHDGRPLQERAAVDPPVAVLVVEIIDALVDLALGQRLRRLGHAN
jgi:hypothetical protein